MSNTQEYNGWPSFATWRVHLEMFDGMDPADMFPGVTDTYDLSLAIKDYCEECIEETSSGLARDWARSFSLEANFYQIAKHMLEAYPAEAEADESEDA